MFPSSNVSATRRMSTVSPSITIYNFWAGIVVSLSEQCSTSFKRVGFGKSKTKTIKDFVGHRIKSQHNLPCVDNNLPDMRTGFLFKHCSWFLLVLSLQTWKTSSVSQGRSWTFSCCGQKTKTRVNPEPEKQTQEETTLRIADRTEHFLFDTRHSFDTFVSSVGKSHFT